ncbi:COR domain-containing protein, partial [Thiotrichales bacterium HSG1]|nr:COR domain-containing protein [Thiotrichales bacterium HSG1]
DLGGNKLTILPKWLGELTQLQELRIYGNQITKLPDSLNKLQNLRRLYLDSNPINKFPEFIRKLPKIKQLWLSYCYISNIPAWINEVKTLEDIWLSNNNITDLPSSLGQLPNLKLFKLYGNPLNPDLAAANEQGEEAVLRYLRDREKNEIVLNEAKLILIGEGGVGKSSLLGALRGDEWIEGRDTTHGVEIQQVKLTEADTEITFNCWDFGGQPVYRPTHQIFFTAPAIYLVVWNPREGPEQGFVDYWCERIKHRAFDETTEPPRILVVATHGGPKQRQAYVDKQGLRERFGDLLVGFYHVDSHTGFGLEELKQTIGQIANSMPSVGKRYPGHWQQVRESLAKRTEPWLSWQDFSTECHNNGLDEPELFAIVSHTLGQLIHYNDDDNLRDIVVLKADWISKAMSFILEDAEIKNNFGLMKHTKVNELWNDPARSAAERYPSQVHPILLAIMEKYELSYRVAGIENTSLIAQLVPGARPEKLAEDWPPHDTEQVQICKIVDAETGETAKAEGLLYQLIVRLHRWSLGKKDYHLSRHWQRGLLLDNDYNGRALLENLGNDIRITVRAAYPGFFLHQLSDEVRYLVESYWKGLRCQIMVPCCKPCDKPGRGLFEVAKLIESRNKGRPEYPCPIPDCDEWQDIDNLLVNAPQPKIATLLENQTAELKQSHEAIKQLQQNNYQALSSQIRTMMSQADEQFFMLINTLTDEARDGPRLFTLTPLNAGFWDKPNWISQKIRLTLWCEHSRLPVPFLENDANKGVYEFDKPREWLNKVAPYAKYVANVLRLALPAASLTTICGGFDNTKFAQIGVDLDSSQRSFNMLLKFGDKANDWRTDSNKLMPHTKSYDSPLRAEGAILRELQAFLKETDPGFAGLRRVQNKKREYLWIHPSFITEYNPEPPVIPNYKDV